MNKYLVLALLFVWSKFTQATPITTAFGPFQFLDNRSSNDAGIVAGVAMQYGVRSVTPNGSDGTTGTAVNGTYSRPVLPLDYTVNPNFFTGGLSCPNGTCDPIAFNPWQITLTNGPDTRIVYTPGLIHPSKAASCPSCPMCLSIQALRSRPFRGNCPPQHLMLSLCASATTPR